MSTIPLFAARHLEVRLDAPEFWRETIASVETRVNAFEQLLDEIDSTA